MRWLNFLMGFFAVVVVAMLIVYFFVPISTIEFNPQYSKGNSSFNLDLSKSNMQFYPNIRYQDKEISYKISEDCSLSKKNEMKEALDIVSNLSILEFYPVLYGEEISILCSDDNIYEDGAFVGGEGGVTNVTIIGDFHVVFNGKILLIRDSDCPQPNIAIHELFHALGFDHSSNPNNVMYETTNCRQEISGDMIELLNQLYSVDSKPDLTFENVSAEMNGKYLNAVINVRNNGFKASPPSKVLIYADGKKIKEIDVSALDIGYGRKITLSNLWVGQISVDEIAFFIDGNFEEMDKSNNEFVLSVKK